MGVKGVQSMSLWGAFPVNKKGRLAPPAATHRGLLKSRRQLNYFVFVSLLVLELHFVLLFLEGSYMYLFPPSHPKLSTLEHAVTMNSNSRVLGPCERDTSVTQGTAGHLSGHI